MYQASDVMTPDVVTLAPETTVEQAMQTLLGQGVSGAPVVDDDGRLVGIISEFRLLEIVFDPALRSLRVADCMTEDVVTVEPSTLLAKVAHLMINHRIRRVPVVSFGQVVGIISRRDLLRYMLEENNSLSAAFDYMMALA